MVCDYYLVRKGYLQVRDLYNAQSSGPYYYTFGVHWRGYVAYIAGILINVVGFAGAVGAKVPVGATYIYNLNFFMGFIVAAIVYWVLCHFWEVPATSRYWLEVNDDGRNNSLAYDPSDSALDEEAAVVRGKNDSEESRRRKAFD